MAEERLAVSKAGRKGCCAPVGREGRNWCMCSQVKGWHRAVVAGSFVSLHLGTAAVAYLLRLPVPAAMLHAVTARCVQPHCTEALGCGTL